MAAAANELGFDPNNNPSGIPVWTPADTVLATADEQNLNKAIPSGTGMGIPGVCTVGPATSGGTQGSPTGATGTRKCTGVGTTKRQYAAGRLVVFSCSASAPLPPATKCNAPPGGYVSPVGQSQPIADIVAKFPAAAKGAVQAANNCSQPILALPYSGSATPGSITGASAAPYGLAAWQALTNFGTGGGGFVSGTEFNSLVGNQCIVIGKTLSDTEKIIREGGPAILTDQTANGTRTAQYALIPRGFVENPNGTEGQPAPVPANLHNPIALYIVVLKHGTLGGSNPATDTSQVDYDRGRAFVNFLLSPIGQAVFQAYGYDSPPAQSTV